MNEPTHGPQPQPQSHTSHPAPRTSSPNEADSALEELQRVAYRMLRGLETKERVVHLQTFKYTFPGSHAVAWMQDAGEAHTSQEATELCNRLLQAGFLKGCVKQEVFTNDSDLYRFPSALAYSNDYLGYADPNYKSRSLSTKLSASLQQSQLYKEIAKIGKAAAQPFKTMSFDSLAHNLAAGRPAHRSFTSDDTALGNSVAQASKLGRSRSAAGCAAEGLPRRSEEVEVLLQLVGGMEGLAGCLREQQGLIRLDLQQHTALQEHMVGLLSDMSAQHQQLHFVAAAAALSTLALLLVVVLQLAAAPLVASTAAALLLGGGAGWWAAWRGLLGGARDISSSRDGLLVGAKGGLLATLHRQSSRGLPLCKSSDNLTGEQAGVINGVGRRSRAASTAAGAAAAGVGPDGDEEEEEGGVVSDGDFADASDDEDSAGAVPCLSDFEGAPDSPLQLRVNPAAPGQTFPGLAHPHAPLRVNSNPQPFESPVFKGVVAVYVRHLGSTPGHLFRGKKRLSWVVIQGRFQRPVSLDTLVTGHEFSRAFRNLPAPWFMENMLLPLARKIAPSLQVGPLEEPHVLAPLITASQIINVSPPGSEPGIMDAKEDMLAFDASLARAGQPLSVAARRKHFQSPRARQRCYDTDNVWTFHLWQEYLDYANYVLALPYSTYDLCQHLDGQPLQIMVKDMGQTSGDSYMVSLLAWHMGLVRGLATSRNNTHVRHHSTAPEVPLSPLRSPTPHHPQQQQQQQQQGRRVSGSGSGPPSTAGGGAGSSRGGHLNGSSSCGQLPTGPDHNNSSSGGSRAGQEGWCEAPHSHLQPHQQQQRASSHGPSHLGTPSSQRHLQPAASSPVPEMGGYDVTPGDPSSYSSGGAVQGRSHLQQHLQASLEVAPRSHSASASVASPSYSQSGRARSGSGPFDRVTAAAAGSSPAASWGGAVGGSSSTCGSPLAGQSPRGGSGAVLPAAAALFSSLGSPSAAAAARKRRPSAEERLVGGGYGVGEASSNSHSSSLPPIPSLNE